MHRLERRRGVDGARKGKGKADKEVEWYSTSESGSVVQVRKLRVVELDLYRKHRQSGAEKKKSQVASPFADARSNESERARTNLAVAVEAVPNQIDLDLHQLVVSSSPSATAVAATAPVGPTSPDAPHSPLHEPRTQGSKDQVDTLPVELEDEEMG